MKVAPVSADLLIKLALAAAVIGVGVWAVRRTTSAIGDAIPDVGGWIGTTADRLGAVASSLGTSAQDFASSIGVNHAIELPPINNPYGISFTPEQQAVVDAANERPGDLASVIGQGVTGDRYWSLGGWIYDLFNPDPLAPASTPYSPIGYGAIDARRIDRSLGY